MKISKIELENWCQYEGEHLFDFGQNSEKNVVLIHADNDVGKSSLFYSIAWCLHEKQPDKWTKKSWPLYPIPWFERAENNESITTSVKIVFEHRNVTYMVDRSFVTRKIQNNAVKVSEFFGLLTRNERGNWESTSEEKLYRILPKSVGGYFIFDAEQVEHFASQSDRVKQSVLRLLDIEDAERASNRLSSVNSSLKSKIKKNDNNKQSQYENELERLEELIKEIKNNIDDQDNGFKVKLKQTKENRKLIEEEIFKFKEIYNLAEEERGIIASLEQNSRDQITSKKDLRRYTQEYYIALMPKISSSVTKFLDEKRKKGELPKNVKKQFIDERIKLGCCICGTKLLEGSENHKTITEFANTLSDNLSDISLTVGNSLSRINERSISIRNNITSNLKMLNRLKNEREKLEGRLKSVRSQIHSRKDIPDVPSLQVKKEKLESNERYLANQIQKAEIDLQNKFKTQETLHKFIKSEAAKSQVKDDAKNKWLVGITAEDAINKAINSFKCKAREYLEQQCNIVAKELFWREDVYKIKINEEYGISVLSKHYGDTDLLAGMSMGATQMTGLSLIAALAKQTKAQAPLIMDTPFARLSPAHITRALSECPKHFQQWILFLQPSEWDNTEYRHVIAPYIQSEYTLKRNNETGVTEAVDGYQKQYFGLSKLESSYAD